MLFDGVLIASDFDGTFANSRGEISTEVQRAVNWFMENGGRFTVCTGRTYQGFHSYSPEYINAPVLLANGGMAYNYASEKLVFLDGIEDDAIPALRAVSAQFPEMCIELYPFGKSWAIHLNERSKKHFTNQGIIFKHADDPGDAPGPWAKVMLGGSRSDIRAVQEYLALNHTQIHFLPTDGEFLEILRPGVDKGSALIKLAQSLSIAPEHVYAVGDGYNDAEMLRVAAEAFVPSNGDEYAKACATHIVRSNDEDAVAEVIDILRYRYSNLTAKQKH